MKKIIVLCMIIVVGLFVTSGYITKTMTVQLYFVDSSMQRLIASDMTIKAASTKKAAKIVVSELIKGRDNNPKIMRIIPNIKNGLTVRVKDETAYVNMTSEFVAAHSDAPNHEVLTIYSIVNSLTSIDGIVNVKFTIDNKQEKKFKGFCDMRETFIPDYYI